MATKSATQEMSEFIRKLSFCLTKAEHTALKHEYGDKFGDLYAMLGDQVKSDIKWLIKFFEQRSGLVWQQHPSSEINGLTFHRFTHLSYPHHTLLFQMDEDTQSVLIVSLREQTVNAPKVREFQLRFQSEDWLVCRREAIELAIASMRLSATFPSTFRSALLDQPE